MKKGAHSTRHAPRKNVPVSGQLFEVPFAFTRAGFPGFEVVGFIGLGLSLPFVAIDGLVAPTPEPLEAPEPVVPELPPLDPILPLPAGPMLPPLALR